MYNFYVILTNISHRVLYIGMTNNLERRISEHKLKIVKGFTQKYNITKLVYFEQITDVGAAIMREKQLKGWLRMRKNELIETLNPDWRDLSDEWIV